MPTESTDTSAYTWRDAKGCAPPEPPRFTLGWLTMGDAVAAEDMEALDWYLSTRPTRAVRFSRWHTEAKSQRERAERAERRVAEWVESHRLATLTAQLREAVEVATDAVRMLN